jgi:LmbE family N-acetylglucosaminyl deacetylase
MLKFGLDKNGIKPTGWVLCLGAHSDDIEIGCGGTILRLTQEYPDLKFYWVVFGASGRRVEEARASAEEFLAPVKEKRIFVEGFRDSFFPYQGADIKEYFEGLKREIDPTLIFTHTRNDLHQDHREICQLTWNSYRNHLILEFEIPKYDGDLGSPNFFVHLDKEQTQQKAAAIMKHFRTQENKDWFTDETFLALMRIRGIESKAPKGYAEAFYGRKIVI